MPITGAFQLTSFPQRPSIPQQDVIDPSLLPRLPGLNIAQSTSPPAPSFEPKLRLDDDGQHPSLEEDMEPEHVPDEEADDGDAESSKSTRIRATIKNPIHGEIEGLYKDSQPRELSLVLKFVARC